MPTSKVAIVGFASSSRDQAPKDDPSFELWGMNNLCFHVRRKWDRWFEMHEEHEMPGAYPQTWNDYSAWLKKFDGPVYMHRALDEFPNSRTFPIDELAPMFGRYYCSTVAYMIALAIAENREEIHLYGVDMVGDDEYGYQRPNAEYLVGFAQGRGIKVFIPSQSALLTSDGVYGLSQEIRDYVGWQTVIKRRLLEVERQQKELVEENRDTLSGIHHLDGLIKGYKESIAFFEERNASMGGFRQNAKEWVRANEKKRLELIKANEDIIATIHACDGALKEGDYYLSRLRSHKRGGSLLLAE